MKKSAAKAKTPKSKAKTISKKSKAPAKSVKKSAAKATAGASQKYKIEKGTTVIYMDQKMGTSGLRKKVRVFQQPFYLEHFVQSLFDCIPLKERKGKKLVLSGDGRYWNDKAIARILEQAVANQVGHVIIGQNGHLSTPAVSHLIRSLNAEKEGSCFGGILLTASHNPGGRNADFGIKFNSPNGGPAPEVFTNAVYKRTQENSRILYADAKFRKVNIKKIQETQFGNMKVSVIDSAD